MCGGKLLRRQSKYGFFLGCENYPDCYFTVSINAETGEIIMDWAGIVFWMSETEALRANAFPLQVARSIHLLNKTYTRYYTRATSRVKEENHFLGWTYHQNSRFKIIIDWQIVIRTAFKREHFLHGQIMYMCFAPFYNAQGAIFALLCGYSPKKSKPPVNELFREERTLRKTTS